MLHAKQRDFHGLPQRSKIEIHPNTPAKRSMEEIQPSTEDVSASDEIEVHVNDEKPETGQYRKIKSASLYAVVMEKDLHMV